MQMAQPVLMEQSRSIPVNGEDAFRGTLMMNVAAVFHRWYGPFPAIRQVVSKDNTWGTVGQTRTLKMAGGGSAVEELTKVDPPHYFTYEVGNIKAPCPWSPRASMVSSSSRPPIRAPRRPGAGRSIRGPL
jgi:hypothetical protein